MRSLFFANWRFKPDSFQFVSYWWVFCWCHWNLFKIIFIWILFAYLIKINNDDQRILYFTTYCNIQFWIWNFQIKSTWNICNLLLSIYYWQKSFDWIRNAIAMNRWTNITLKLHRIFMPVLSSRDSRAGIHLYQVSSILVWGLWKLQNIQLFNCIYIAYTLPGWLSL